MYMVQYKCRNFLLSSSVLTMEAISSSGMSGQFTLYQTTLHCILEDSCLLIFRLKFLGFYGKKNPPATYIYKMESG